ncbi:MAG: DPP IV N-terminal domain-containing protein [Paraprevotella sp.]|nr:DPP IV N-terminal domain-containing protein [Paraprevotella sp.]
MKNFIFASWLLLGVFISSAVCRAQGTAEDYKRAYSAYGKFHSGNVYDQASEIRWYGNQTFSYATHTPKGRAYFVGTLKDGKTDIRAVNMDSIASAISVQMKQNITRSHLRLEHVYCDTSNPTTLRFVFRNFHWSVEESCSNTPIVKKEHAVEQKRNSRRQRHWMEVDDEKNGRPVPSPDGKHVAYIKNDNVYVSDVDGKNERALSNDGTPGNYYSSYLQWSADGRKICGNRIRPAEKRYVYYVESAPRTQLQPILHKQEYAKPGDELRFKVPCVFDVDAGKTITPSTELFSHQYDLRGPRWNKEGTKVVFEYNQRGHQIYRVLEMDATSGAIRTVIEEKSNTFVNYNRYFRHPLKDEREMLWMSERDNWNHLYLYDWEKAKVVKQITRGEWVVRRVVKVDETKGKIYFTASGVNPNEDPYLIHYYSIGLDGKNMKCLTPENGNHDVQFNEDFTYLIDTYSRADQAPVTVLRSVENPEETQIISCADISRLVEQGWQMPEVFAAPGRDGKTMMWGLIQRPTNFDPNRSYPIIEYIYAGPGDAYTPKSFLSYNHNMTALAELGFIVVQLDAMGTSYRGKKFEDVCYKNLKDAGFPDRMEWMRAAAAKYPYMDLNNVGIYGASAGGQESTAAVLFHPEFYKAAYSSCGCHDNRMDKIWWNEQWMGYPVDSSYIASSNVENAHKLTRPLMLVVGEMDDNVDPASTMQVAAALIRAGKDFELVVLPGGKHTMGDAFGEHKRYDFFVRHLMKKNPPAWDEVK